MALGSLNQRRTTLSTPTPSSILFQATWGGPYVDYADGVASDPLGNVYVSGHSNRFCCNNSVDAFLLKFSPNGSLLWQRKWSGNESYIPVSKVVADASGNVYVAGYTISNSFGDEDAALLKFSSSGLPLWQRKWGGTSRDYASGIALSPSGDVYVVGSTSSFGFENAFMLKFGSNGSLVSQITWGTGLDLFVTGVSLDSLGNVFVSGFGGGNQDAFLAKFGLNGSLEWQKMWGEYGKYTVTDTAVSVDSAGNAYETGMLQSYYPVNVTIPSSVNTTIPIVKFDSSGGVVWQRVWPGGNVNFCCSTSGNGLVIDSSDNIFLAGQTSPDRFPGGRGMLLLKLSSNGDLKWEAEVGAGNSDVGRSITLDSSGNLIAVGSVNEDPPYNITSLNFQLAPIDFILQTVSGQVTIRNVSAMPFNSVFLASSGNTTYAGQSDAYIVKLEPPISVTTYPAILFEALVVVVVSASVMTYLRRRRFSTSIRF